MCKLEGCYSLPWCLIDVYFGQNNVGNRLNFRFSLYNVKKDELGFNGLKLIRLFVLFLDMFVDCGRND